MRAAPGRARPGCEKAWVPMSARGGRGQLHPTTQTFSARACSGWLRGVRDRASRRLGLTCHPWSGIWPTAVCTTTRPGTLDQPTGTRACPGQLAPTGNHPRHGGEGQKAERFFFLLLLPPFSPPPSAPAALPGGGRGGREAVADTRCTSRGSGVGDGPGGAGPRPSAPPDIARSPGSTIYPAAGWPDSGTW